ncbi:MAG: DUF1566 domain-containing protein [Bacteroidales bacterium]
MKQYLLSFIYIILSGMTMAQGVLSLTPSSSPINTSGVNISIVLDSTLAPPDSVMPLTINIGPSLGFNVIRNHNSINATFNFSHMISGEYNIDVVFPGGPANPTIYLTSSAAFTVTDTVTTPWFVAGTNVTHCYDTVQEITCPGDSSAPFFGQTNGITPSYINNGDGTITDRVTGLMWQRDPGPKRTYIDALSGADTLTLGGHNDWRLPTIKELYSLIEFTGLDPSGVLNGTPLSLLTPFIDTNYFVFHYGDTTSGYRIIDAQYWSCSEYVSTVMGNDHSVFGVNFADGRIKSYPRQGGNQGPGDTKQYAQYVRGKMKGYGFNHFVDNGDSTITDQRTQFMWSKGDCGHPLNWQDALAWVQTKNSQHWLGHNDWRLPTTKELESIVDYTRSPATTNSPAIDSLFYCTGITNEAGQADYPYYWSSTTHYNYMAAARNAAYISFGRAMGYMNGTWEDVHGAGAQRSDPKQGDPNAYPHGHGPQWDAIRIYNYLRCVRDITYPAGIEQHSSDPMNFIISPNPSDGNFTITFNLKQEQRMRIECCSTSGAIVFTSDIGLQPKGEHRLTNTISSGAGVYFLKIIAGPETSVKKVVIF